KYGKILVKPALQTLVQGSQDKIVTVVYFIKVMVHYEFPNRLDILCSVLAADKNGTTTQHLDTKHLSLKKGDLFNFVETYLPLLIQQNLSPSNTELIKSYIERYFEMHTSAELIQRQSFIEALI